MTKPIIKTVFWDLDGTLIDSEHLHADAAFVAFERLNIPLITREITPGIENKLAFAELTGLDLRNDLNQRLFEKWDRLVVDLVLEEININDAIHQSLELFTHFNSLGITQTVVSNSYLRLVKHSLQQLGIIHQVHQIHARDMVTHAKPSPELYNNALRGQMNQQANCLAFEDSNTGIKAAQSAGIMVVGIGKANRNILELDPQQDSWLNTLNQYYQF